MPSSTKRRRKPYSARPRRPAAQAPLEAPAELNEPAASSGPTEPRSPAPRPGSTRSRRTTPAVSRAVALPRSVEYAYIRDDLRRLMVIAGGLLALMLVILIALNR